MNIVSDKFYSSVAAIFVFFVLLGYQLFTTLFLPLQSDVEEASRIITYPYRALVLFLAVVLIITRPKTSLSKRHGQWGNLFIAFLLVYFIRILFDLYMLDVFVKPTFRITVIQYLFLSIIPSLWAIKKCVLHINYHLLNKLLFLGSIFLLFLYLLHQNSLANVEAQEELQRSSANIALGSIGFGQSCVTIILILYSWLITHKTKKIVNAILIMLIVISFVIMISSGSRGPLFTFLAIAFFLMYSRTKHKIIVGIFLFFLLFVIWYNVDVIISFLGRFSGTMEQRLIGTIYENDSSGRDILYSNAYNLFLQNPILGSKFVTDSGVYSHNMILDVFMGLGLFGGLLIIILIIKCFAISSYHHLKKSPIIIISLISVQYILFDMLSGAIYTDTRLILTMFVVLFLQRSTPSSEGSFK